MRITIQVKPNSKKVGIEKVSDSELIVRVNAPPVDGKANKAVVEALAAYFKVPKSSVQILKGEGAKRKLVEVFFS